MTIATRLPSPPGSVPENSLGMDQALNAIRVLRTKVESLELSRRESLAIVGIGCRLPGGIDSPSDFWTALSEGRDTVGPIPRSRWDTPSFYDPDPATPGRMHMREGAFIEGVDRFDPYFFGISPREAARMDPQQRIFLEVAWEALEDAGLTRQRLQGSATGVFVGANSTDYLQLQLAEPDLIDTYTIVGGTTSIIANRLSYLLDLRGPSLCVDTACSSSLVALHLAVQSLRSGEIDTAVVGGVNLILSPIATIAHSKGMPLAADGRCKTFDARANGYVRGEGVVAITLKRLSDAIADSDAIWAVIRGSAVNQDGMTNGLTAPNGRSQRLVIEQALSNARVDAGAVTLLEAHGTGTSLGDPIEVETLVEVYGGGAAERRCALGSAKTNVGHLEAGAGLVGVVKAALSIRHEQIAPNLHFESINPHIELDGSALFVPTALTPWDVPAENRNAAVSSFGAGGTNAHIVLGPAPAGSARLPVGRTDEASGWGTGVPQGLAISAPSEAGLAGMIRAYRDHLRTPAAQAQPWSDVAFSAAHRRTPHEHRCVVVAVSAQEAAERLTLHLNGDAVPTVVTGRAGDASGRGTVFVFPALGAQRARMGMSLMRHSAAFRAAILECDELMAPLLGYSIVAAIRDEDEQRLSRVEVALPANFAVSVALAAHWRSIGVVPDAVVGHGLGEAAAAYVAGALSLPDAVTVMCHSAIALGRLSGTGAMLAVAMPPEAARELIGARQDCVAVAVVNSPASTVLSGDAAVLAEIEADLHRRHVPCQLLDVTLAAHTAQIRPLGEDLSALLSGIVTWPVQLPMISTVTGRAHDAALDAAYWVDNLCGLIRFEEAVRQLIEADYGVYVELSAQPVLTSAVRHLLDLTGSEGLTTSSLRGDLHEAEGPVAALAALHCRGYEVPEGGLTPAQGRLVELPGYEWQRESLWFRSLAAGPSPAPQAAQVPVPKPGPDAEAVGDVRSRLAKATDNERRRRILADAVAARVAQALELNVARIDPGAGFIHMGMDSLLAAQIHGRLTTDLGVTVPVTIMYEHPTVDALAGFLAELLHAETPVRETVVRPQPVALPTTSASEDNLVLDELSEDDLLALLVDEVRISTRRSGGISDTGEL